MYLFQLFFVLFIYEAHSVRVKDIIHKKVYYNLSEARDLFDDYIEHFNKTYESKDQYEKRLEIFTNRLELFNHHNTLSEGIFGLSKYTDLKDHELNMSGCYVPDSGDSAPENDVFVPLEGIPDQFNWLDHNVVTSVKDQKDCGACWAFAATGAIEGLYARTNKKLMDFSEQEVLDCSGGGNCSGGDPADAMNGIAQYGMMSATDYPYIGNQSKCGFNSSSIKFKFQGAKKLINKDEEQLKQNVFMYGPLTASLYTNETLFWHYNGDVINGKALGCKRDRNNHAVLIVGYGTSPKGIPYWIIKNSFGPDWGGKAHGYMYLERGQNACGINDEYAGAAIL